jgi:hypothetical protein
MKFLIPLAICLSPFVLSLLIGLPLYAWLHHKGKLIGEEPK